MEIVIVPTPKDGGRIAADIVCGAMENGAKMLGLATGSSPLHTYQELIRRHRESGVSFAAMSAYLLDEYVSLTSDQPQSYAHTIRAELVDHIDIDPARVFSPDGGAEDPNEAARRYDATIAENGPIDVQILGIGLNGHIGFNEPSSSLASRTRVKTLTGRTRADNARFFTESAEVPHHVITQGLGTISDARHLVLVADGARKASAVRAAVEGPVSAFCPASVLQLHPHVTVIVDEAAADELELAEFYRYTTEHKPASQGY
ncbi:glucosamine-6-phosphate deaminase [Rhodococcus sp. IEGM 1379]|uniref:glucosamine-6-phosphate deaminase n=1 Tax=Rhodococcus sp. IEGM 1379 TaxID=3047086 RepID=UPI0024B640FC|nr:glucosamine-6-phosphate deaminase [Rhodococcus sp. IEGM 1379]MDI9919000.1 glucosamine-6-phosphate deaminase [Rhodococcus sp. IEGM 1379]